MFEDIQSLLGICKEPQEIFLDTYPKDRLPLSAVDTIIYNKKTF
jgi:hypothetical protein